jgi:hypothetical protein
LWGQPGRYCITAGGGFHLSFMLSYLLAILVATSNIPPRRRHPSKPNTTRDAVRTVSSGLHV